jgi:hypothetical protein
MPKEQSCENVTSDARTNFMPAIHHRYKYLEEVVLVLKLLSEGYEASKIASEYFEDDLNPVFRWIEFTTDIGLIDSNNNNRLTDKGKKWQKDIGNSFWGRTSY